MATLDDILSTDPQRGWSRLNPSGNPNAPESGGEEITPPVEQSPKSNDVESKPPVVTTPQATSSTETTKGGYLELLQALNPYTPPTAEELEKEKKRQKRKEIFAALGDGITALSNLYFTTQGAPNMYDGKNTMSEATRVRYDKLLKDRDEKAQAYFSNYIRAKQADDANTRYAREWERGIARDEENDRRYNEGIEHRNERERIADERYNSEQEYKKSRDEEADRRWQATFNEDRRRSDRSHNFQVTQHNDNVSVRREQARATAARGVRGNRIGFADAEGHQVNIYENVWKGSMQQVYDILIEDLAPASTDRSARRTWDRENGGPHDTSLKKDDFVKRNWHKSQRARELMSVLSTIDPATMTSDISEDIEEYNPESDDEVIEYRPQN